MSEERYKEDRPTFGAWLLKQSGRGDWVDELADAARADRGFPRHGSPDDVRKRLNELQADGDMHAAVDDAETDWLSI